MPGEITVPRVISGPGKHILIQVVRPLLETSDQYDRVSCYYSPRSLIYILDELAEMWKRGGSVRLIIGFHESAKIIPAIKEDGDGRRSVTDAVALALRGAARKLARLIEREHQELIPTLRELIVHKGLHVRLVTPSVNVAYLERTGKWPNPEVGIFHSKFAIFHQRRASGLTGTDVQTRYYRPAAERLRTGERFTATSGSLNETERGYGENVEDVVVHRSWVAGESDVAAYLSQRFEELWFDLAEDVVTMPFDDEFAAIVEEIVRRLRPEWLRWKHFAAMLTKSPLYCALALPQSGLLPHQYRCYREGLSRWPIRILLADEVGLGKTIEAGSILYYLLNFGGVRRVAILTPASLRHQWQRELQKFFGLEFWVYNSGTDRCELNDEELDVQSQPLAMDRVILSWHWARLGATAEACRFDDSELPDLLIVDEAHHARLHEGSAGGLDQTQLYSLLDRLRKRIPHIVLLTATPFQTNQLDYFGLLNLLGIPPWFTRKTLHQFARWTRGELLDNFDQRAKEARQCRELVHDYKMQKSALPPDLLAIPVSSSATAYEDYINSHGPIPKERILAVHPTTLLTLRNTRSALRSQGYQFPNAHLSSAGIQISHEQAEWFEELEHYVRNRLGSVETSGNTSTNIARLRSLFRQRVVSSIRAARDSLANRLALLNEFISSHDPTRLAQTLGVEFDPSDNDAEDAAPELQYPTALPEEISSQFESAKNEAYAIERLLSRIEFLFQQGNVVVDPKMERLREVVKQHLDEGRKVLIFSRFTSTTEAAVEALRELVDSAGVGRFDGKAVGVLSIDDSNVIIEPCARRDIEAFLRMGRIRVLVCSDAASEGLNLQAASVAINVDVPWNPSRVLQRFGRVDRLGQKAPDVYLMNMYYPLSIEARMYSVLEDRRVDFMTVLGEVPEILSEQQQKLLQHMVGAPSSVGLTFEQIQRARSEYNDSQFRHLVMKGDTGDRSTSLQEELLRALSECALHEGRTVKDIDKGSVRIDGIKLCVNPMDDDFVPLVGREWEEYESRPRGQGGRIPVVPLKDENGRPLALLLRSGNYVFPLTTELWPLLFVFFFAGDALDLSRLNAFSAEDLTPVLTHILSKEEWIRPDHTRMVCLAESSPEAPSIGKVSLGDPIGFVLATGFRVPQANDLRKVAELPLLIQHGRDDKRSLAAHFGFHPRQSVYYAEAAELLGLISRAEGRYQLTEDGRAYCQLSPVERTAAIVERIQAVPVLRALLTELRSRPSHALSRSDIDQFVRKFTRFSGSTPERRSQAIVAWLRFIAAHDAHVQWTNGNLIERM